MLTLFKETKEKIHYFQGQTGNFPENKMENLDLEP